MLSHIIKENTDLREKGCMPTATGPDRARAARLLHTASTKPSLITKAPETIPSPPETLLHQHRPLNVHTLDCIYLASERNDDASQR